jgi:hypothetical protein
VSIVVEEGTAGSKRSARLVGLGWWINSWDRLLLAVALILGAATGLVIWHPTKDAGTWWLVGATGALALLTGLLALGTFSSVRQASRTAAAAEADLQQGLADKVLLIDLNEEGTAANREAPRVGPVTFRTGPAG